MSYKLYYIVYIIFNIKFNNYFFITCFVLTNIKFVNAILY